MQKTIRAKLFLIFLLTTLLTISVMYIFMRWSLERGFKEFIESRQQERVTFLINDLAEFYAANQNWDKLLGNKQKWIDLLWQSSSYHKHPPDWINKSYKEPNNVWPPTLSELPTRRHFNPLQMRTMLLNVDKSIIFGRQEALSKLALHPIHYQGNIVGYLGLLPGKIINANNEVHFMEQVSKSFISIALLMITLSAMMSLMLSYKLGLYINRITSFTHALALGNYNVRLPIETTNALGQNDELGQLARDFNELASALDQTEQARRRWVADISHELRTPLAILSGEIEALRDGIHPLTPEAINSLYSEVIRINRLTDDLYQLSLSDQGSMTYHKAFIDPIALLKDILNQFSPKYEAKHISIQWINNLHHVIQMYADQDRLSQLYCNLLTNSANYTDTDGQLVITITQDNDSLLIDFSDSTPGVHENELARLFERFYRVESSRNLNHGGAGLGLALCANIVKAHHGSIHAEPSAFNGLTIKIELPINL